jgi:hypothetical protein
MADAPVGTIRNLGMDMEWAMAPRFVAKLGYYLCFAHHHRGDCLPSRLVSARNSLAAR